VAEKAGNQVRVVAVLRIQVQKGRKAGRRGSTQKPLCGSGGRQRHLAEGRRNPAERGRQAAGGRWWQAARSV